MRRRVLETTPGPPPTTPIAEAEWWQLTANEPNWLVRRARRTAHLLRRLPLEVWPDELIALFEARLADRVASGARELDVAWRRRAEEGAQPLMSCLTDACIERGLDVDAGGARYNGAECGFVGLANLADGLLAIKKLVYEERRMTLSEFDAVLRSDFEGREPLRQEITNRLGKYGNDDAEADRLAARLVAHFTGCCDRQRIGEL
ncbi:MAG: hypothetical protein JXQ73_20085 [Phycisphaerae bacterium]|nr:hypothetical protein [Phycisphaerae bacterium]